MAAADRGGTLPHASLPRTELIPWPGVNPRRRFTEEELAELRESIVDVGILQPLGVTLQDEPPHFIYAGERRWRASEGVLEELPVVIRQIDEATARRLALLENIQRSDLSPVEEARGMMGYLDASGSTQKSLADDLGKTQGWVSNRLRLLKLPEGILEIVQAERMTASQARDLILPFSTLTDEQWELLTAAVQNRLVKKLESSEGSLSDEDVREIVSSVAVAMSGWLDEPLWDQEDKSSGFNLYTRLSPEHWKDAPKGQVITYVYGRYGRKSSRCFDEKWWTSALKAAEKREKARQVAEERRWREEAKKRPSESQARNIKWKPSDGVYTKELGWNQRHIVYQLVSERSSYYVNDLLEPFRPLDSEGKELEGKQYDMQWRVFADPALLPADKLVLFKPRGVKQPMVLCTSAKVYDEARASLERQKKEIVAERLQRQAEADMESASKIDLRKALPEILSMGTTLDPWEGEHWIDELADELGLELPKAERVDYGHDEAWLARYAWTQRERLRRVPAADLERMVQLAVFRLATKGKNGMGLMTRANIERSVNFELRVKFQRELEEKILFELPSHDEPKPKKKAKAKSKRSK